MEARMKEITPDCACENTHLTRRKVSNGAIQYWMQCLRCGRSQGSAIAIEKALNLARRMGFRSLNDVAPWDQALQDGYLAKKRDEWEERRIARQVQWDANAWERDEAYQQYLKTPVWRQKRQLVMQRADGKCEGCGLSDAAHVHHLEYPKPWGTEFLFQLVALCAPCHERIHGR